MAHLLQTPWTFYHFQFQGKTNTPEEWAQSIYPIAQVKTIEDLERLEKYIKFVVLGK